MAADMTMPEFCGRKNPFHYTTALNVLSRMGIDTFRVRLLAVGRYANYRGEIMDQKPKAGTPLHPDSDIELEIGYPSPVDYMPYQFFYGFRTSSSRGSEWEDKARRLMAPFDATVIRSEARTGLASLTFLTGFGGIDQKKRFLKLFDFSEDSIEDDELMFWSTLLPYFNHWGGNPEFLSRIITSLLGDSCEIVENVQSTHEISEELQYKLGSDNGRLGVSTVAGGTYTECDTAYELLITDVAEEDIPDYLEGGKKRMKLEAILSRCMPTNLECMIVIRGIKSSSYLGRDGASCCLGYTSFV